MEQCFTGIIGWMLVPGENHSVIRQAQGWRIWAKVFGRFLPIKSAQRTSLWMTLFCGMFSITVRCESTKIASLNASCIVGSGVLSAKRIGGIPQNKSLLRKAGVSVCACAAQRRAVVAVAVGSNCHRRRERCVGIRKRNSSTVIIVVGVNGKLLQSRGCKVVSVVRYGARACRQFPHVLARGGVDWVPRRDG